MALNFCRKGGRLSAAELVRDRWVLRIVEEMLAGAESYEVLLERLGIARNILADRLKMMVGSGLVEREPNPDDMRTNSYFLTAKGRDLKPVIEALRRWLEKHGN